MKNRKLFEVLGIDKMVVRSTGAQISAETQGGAGCFKLHCFECFFDFPEFLERVGGGPSTRIAEANQALRPFSLP